MAQQYEDLISSQREAEEAQRAEREQAISDLRTAIQEQTSTAEAAAAGERSALSAALEGRIQEARDAAAAEEMMKQLDGKEEEPVDMAMEEPEEPTMVLEKPEKTGLMARI